MVTAGDESKMDTAREVLKALFFFWLRVEDIELGSKLSIAAK